MTSRSLRRYLPTLIVLVIAGVAIGILVARSHTTVTQARIERALPPTFARLYVQQAELLGHRGVTVQSLHVRAQCDKGGPKVADSGPGNNWICLMSWHDPNIDQTVLPGKFEVNIHSNDCYTAGGPSKIVGLAIITDKNGNDATNPVFEFDGCFDPRGSNRATGVTFPTTTTSTSSTTTPAALSLPGQASSSERRGTIKVNLACSAGVGGCAGTITAQIQTRTISKQYVVAAGKTSAVTFPIRTPLGGSKLVVHVAPVIGTAPELTMLPVTRRS